MARPPINKSWLFWVAILIFSVLDVLAAIGIRTVIRLLGVVAQLDWLSPWLVIVADLDQTLVPAISLFELLIVAALSFVAVYHVAATTDFLPPINSVGELLLSTALLCILYVLFAITQTGLPAFVPGLSPQQGWILYYGLLGIAISCIWVLPYIHSLVAYSNPTLPAFQGDIGSVLAAGFLFTGGLATLASMDVGLAVVAIVVSVSRLSKYRSQSGIGLEERLVKTLQLLDRGPIGFAVVFSLLTGVVVASAWYSLVTSGVPFVQLAIVTGFPTTKLGIFTAASFIGGSAITVIASVALLQTQTLDFTLEQLAIGLLVALWFLLGGLFWWQSAIGPDRIPFAFGESVVYAVFLASGLVVIGLIREWSTSKRLYYLSIGILYVSLGPTFLDQSIFARTLFLDLAVLGYWGGPLFERIGIFGGELIESTS